jgi:hypothetical protein
VSSILIALPSSSGDQDRPHSMAELEASLPGGSIVVLVDCATAPFTADMTGPGQTTTDSTRTASTCAVHSLRR